MGVATLDALITSALLMGGNTRVASRAKEWLKDWLRSQAASFPWPQVTADALVTGGLVTNAQSVLFGAGQGGEARVVQRINDPLWLYTADKRTRQMVRIQTAWGDMSLPDDDTVDAASNKGLPTMCRVLPVSLGQWKLLFDKVADKDYSIKLNYRFIPTDPGDNDVPWYPNDRTMKRLVEAEVYRWNKETAEYNLAANEASSMLIDDKMKYGSVPGMNDGWGLDPRVFK